MFRGILAVGPLAHWCNLGCKRFPSEGTLSVKREGMLALGGFVGVLHVPKKELVGTLQVLLQTRRLQVSRSLPDAAVLVQELENFRAKVTAAKKETLESWREGRHDDLVLAVAMAAWLGEQALTMPDDQAEEFTLEQIIVL